MSAVTVQRALNAPPAKVGAMLMSAPEDQWFDRKSARIAARDLADALIGFANADGGIVAVGLLDETIEGTDRDPKRRNSQMQAAIDFCSPPVRSTYRLLPCRRDDGTPDHLLVFEIDSAEGVHANVKDEVFLRVGDETRRLTFAQRQELVFDKGQSTYEVRAVAGSDLDDLDTTVLSGYASAVGHPDAARLLRNLGLAGDSGLNVGGCLLFARDPQRFLPEAFVRVLRYRGSERGSGARQQLVGDVRLDGPLPSQLTDAQAAVREVQPVRRALMRGGRFGDVALVPEDAWLEGLVNAVVHRSYSLAGDHIRIDVFDDRIEVSSPGRFPGLVDLADPLATTRFARNPRIARVCKDLEFGQELGEGIRRIFEEMRQAGLHDPVYRQTSASVQLTLSAEPIDRALEARLPQEARAVTAALREAGRLSTGEIEEVVGMRRPAVRRRLQEMEQAGLIRWVGKSPKDPRAYWTLPPT